MNRIRFWAAGGVAVATVLLAGWLVWPVVMHSTADAIRKSRELRVGNEAPDFSLKDAHGKVIHLRDFRGKAVLLNFWATWCGPCKMEIPWFIDFQQKKAAAGFTVLGVSMDEDGWKSVSPYAAEHHINYPVLLADEEVNQRYGGIESLPTSLLVDPRGKIKYIARGLVDKAEWEHEIDQTLRTH